MNEQWKNRYYDLAGEVATWSKDPSKKVGAIIVGNHGQVLSQGYNGFPRGMDDDPKYYDDREKKYERIVHAEVNAIYNATRNGVSLDGSTMFVYGLPTCHECAKAIIQVGISEVVMGWEKIPHKWQKSCHLAEKFFDESKVKRTYLAP